MFTSGVSKWPGAALVIALSIALPQHAAAQASPNVAAVDPQAPQKGIGERAKERAGEAIDKVDDAVRRAADIFKRVPCSNKGVTLEGSLPGVAKRLAANEPVTIVAFGSSSTVGYGATSPIFSYPYRLADQLRRKFPLADITVLNRGIGGEDAAQMMARLQGAVLDAKPDLVIWQVGTNIVIRGDDAAVARTEALVSDGIDRIKAAGSDVVLIDPQYAPATSNKDVQGKTSTMVKLLGRVANAKQVARFPRFAVMRNWYDDQKLSFDEFVIADGLHMNDWGYACFAQLLGDTIIATVTRADAAKEQPEVMLVRPR